MCFSKPACHAETLDRTFAPTVVWRAFDVQGGEATLDRCCFTANQVTTAGSFLVRPIPEPSTGLLLAIGLDGLGSLRRRPLPECPPLRHREERPHVIHQLLARVCIARLRLLRLRG